MSLQLSVQTQIVNPIAVTAAIFSMPDAVKVNPKSFVVAIVISMVVMRLLMLISGFFGWWPELNARIKAIQMDLQERVKIATTQIRHGKGEATYDVEMHTFDGQSNCVETHLESTADSCTTSTERTDRSEITIPSRAYVA